MPLKHKPDSHGVQIHVELCLESPLLGMPARPGKRQVPAPFLGTYQSIDFTHTHPTRTHSRLQFCALIRLSLLPLRIRLVVSNETT
jgi:hypothetical protein